MSVPNQFAAVTSATGQQLDDNFNAVPHLNAANKFTNAQNYATSVVLASAGTVNIGAAASNNITISGAVTINAFDTIAEGALRFVTFSGALQLTYNVTSMQLIGGVTRTVAAGDTSLFRSLGSGNWKEELSSAIATTATTATNQSGGTVAATTITASGTIIGSAKVSGATATGNTTNAAIVGIASSNGDGVYGSTATGVGVYGAASGAGTAGVYGYSANSLTPAIYAQALSGYGLVVETDTTTPAKAALRLVPQDANPSTNSQVGDIYVTTAGVLKICTVAGSPGTWVSVGAQT